MAIYMTQVVSVNCEAHRLVIRLFKKLTLREVWQKKAPLRHYIRILPDDRVIVELSPYDLTRGRIVYRYK